MRIFKYIGFVLLLSVVAASCDNSLEEINVNPNATTAVPAETLLAQGEYRLFNSLQGRTLNAEWGMLMVQLWAQNEYCEESRYEVDGGTFNGSFSGLYVNSLEDFRNAKLIIEENTTLTAGQKANQLAILEILNVVAFQALTDGFGAIPYTQALNSEFPNPAYDSQKDIYTSLLSRLKAAVESMDVTSSSFASGELLYGGDVAKWKKLANSLMLRAAMRISDVDAATAQTYVTAAAADLMTSNADNAAFIFDANSSVANPLWIDANINNRDDFCPSELLIQRMQNTNDPRLSAYAAVNDLGEYVGMPYGLDDNTATTLKPTASRPAADVRAATAPYLLMDYANVEFLLAEAYERGFLSGDAAAAYNNAVTASMAYWGVDGAEYLAANAYDATNWKQSIGEQKWLALYMSGYEAWAEWRRLDYPVLAVPAAATLGSIPVRLPYPIDEQTNNATSLGAVTNDPNSLTTKLWWDVN